MATDIDTVRTEPTPKEVAVRIGDEYINGTHNDTNIRRSFDEIACVNRELFNDIPVPVRFQESDPYNDYQDMVETVGEERILRVYNGHAKHPYMSEDENLMGRAVHDWYGHLGHDVDFSPAGEFRKWFHMKDHYAPLARRAFFTEVVGQVGAVHYLPDGFEDDRFEQKCFHAPVSWLRDMETAVMR